MSSPLPAITIAPAQTDSDVAAGYRCAVEAFGRQTHDRVWMSRNPAWDTPAGVAAGESRAISRWRASNPQHTVYVVAKISTSLTPDDSDDPSSPVEVVAGMAIWTQYSACNNPAHGAPPPDYSDAADLGPDLWPDDPATTRFSRQAFRSLYKMRVVTLAEKAAQAAAEGKEEDVAATAACVLDSCVVDPVFQRRGIATKLVQWGLDEAKRRGGLECMTEGSRMGRLVYLQMGFKAVKDIEFEGDEEFRDWGFPPNVFLRTGP